MRGVFEEIEYIEKELEMEEAENEKSENLNLEQVSDKSELPRETDTIQLQISRQNVEVLKKSRFKKGLGLV